MEAVSNTLGVRPLDDGSQAHPQEVPRLLYFVARPPTTHRTTRPVREHQPLSSGHGNIKKYSIESRGHTNPTLEPYKGRARRRRPQHRIKPFPLYTPRQPSAHRTIRNPKSNMACRTQTDTGEASVRGGITVIASYLSSFPDSLYFFNVFTTHTGTKSALARSQGA